MEKLKTDAENIKKETANSNEKEIQDEKLTVNEEKDVVELEIPKYNNNKKIWVVLVILAILIILAALSTTIFAVINMKNTKILKNISIGETDTSNLTKEEAKEKLEEVYGVKADKQIYLSHGEYDTSVTYESLEIKYQIEEAVEEAYQIGREGNVFQNNFKILNVLSKGRNIELKVKIDEDMIKQIAQNINNSIEDAASQPSYYIEKNEAKLIITSGKQGVKVD